MSKGIETEDKKPEEIVPAAFQNLIIDGFQRIDGNCSFNDLKYRFAAYKVSQPVPLIRIDIRRIENE